MTHKNQSFRIFTLVLLGAMLGLPQPGLAGKAAVELTPGWLLVDVPGGAVHSIVLRVAGPDGGRISETRTQHNSLEWPMPMDAPDGLYSYEVFVQTRRPGDGETSASQGQPTGNIDSQTRRGLFRIESGTARPELYFGAGSQ